MTIQVEEAVAASNEEDQEEMAGGEHGEIAVILSGHLFNHVYPNKLGRVFDGQTTFTVGGTPSKRRPDVAFVTLDRMPKRVEGEIPFAPDLAVEIFSPTDAADDNDKKVIQYQQANVRLIWVVRPVLKLIEVFHPGDLKPLTLGINDELDGEDLLPGFKLKVSALFEY